MSTHTFERQSLLDTGDYLQLDAFNHETNEYECVMISTNRDLLSDLADSLALKCWRVWNLTKRVDRDRMLLPTSRLVKTFNHNRRFSLVHRTKRGGSLAYKRWAR